MRLTTKELLAAHAAINKLPDTLPMKVGRHFARALRKMRPEIEAYQEARDKWVKGHGEGQADGSFKLKPEQVRIFNEMIEEMQAKEIEIDVNPISFGSLGLDEEKPAGISAATIEALYPFFDDF